ncbi:PREDICTED: KH domain-containing protein HEN4 isoform X4 [Theobroma cacao]|uniref:KH domain-containing protein HEN4 isoform X4 n=1 Tax=Theobroma cacao TaxID=3641 RepID=A0AB32VVU4_THECC|nr:PREDICTED: KH domain-containing protein HEN4 isoform X4 [Theobroma cacao]
MQNPYNRRRGRQGPPVTIVPLPGEVSFRIICHVSSIGGVIGNSGAVVSQLRRETSSRIHCEEPVRGSAHRVILIVGSGSVERRFSLGEGEECDVSCAQEAMVRVFQRVWEVEAEREWGNACDGEDEEAYCGVLADTTQIGAVVGRGGNNIVRMRAETGAKIRILPPPPCGRKNDELIQITGGTLAVKKALVAVSGCLQACPPLDRESTPMSVPTEKPSRGTSPEPHIEFFPHLSSLLPPMSANSVSASSNATFSSMDADGDSNLDSNGTQKEVVFRMLCSNGAAGAIIGKKGAIVRALQNQTGASIMFASPVTESGERVVTISALEITGEYKSVQNAIFQVTSRLRHNLLPPEVLNEMRVRNCYGKVSDTGVPQAYQPTSLSSDTDQGPNLAQRTQPGLSDNTAGPLPFKLQPQQLQTTGNGCTVATQDAERGSTTFGGSLDLERSLDFLLPREVLNEVGGRSPCKGGSETTSGLLQSLGLSLDSDQENALTRAVGNLGLSNSVGCPPKSPLLETVRRGHGLANAEGTGGLELESSKKSAVVKNTSVEIVVPEDVFGSIYGKHGCNLARLKEISGAKVEVHDPSPGDSEGIVFISGTPDQTLIAQSLLQAFIQANQ